MLTENAQKVFEQRYALVKADGTKETWQETVKRVVDAVIEGAQARNKKYSWKESEIQRGKYEKMIENLDFLPNSPTFTGAGTPLGQLAACFVLPISDDMGIEPDGIFSTLRNAALIQQTGGGNGFSFSRLRPRGSVISKSKGVATGPIGFIKVYNAAFGEIAQGGCFVGSTLIATADGPKPIRDIQEGDMLYSFDKDEGFVLRPSTKSWLTKKNAEVWKLTTDKGLEVYATPDHPFMVRPDNEYVKMSELEIGTPLLPLTRYVKDEEWVISLHDGTDKRMPEHVWMANQLGIYGEHIHHKDGEHLNNVSSNLRGMDAADHARLHGMQKMVDGTHPFIDMTDEQRVRGREEYSQWFASLTTDEQHKLQSRRATSLNAALLEKGEHNFQTNPPMRNKKSKKQAMQSRIATSLWKVMAKGLPVSEETWEKSKGVLYNSQQFTLKSIENAFGSFDAALEYCNERNHRVISVGISHSEDVYNVEVPGTHNYVVCNDFRRGVVVSNTRRGANMAILDISHPDIEEFIDCKRTEGDLANFNVSVAVTDAFMKAANMDLDFDLTFNGKVHKTVKARALLDRIAENAHRNGEPGIIFIDEMNRTNPMKHMYEIEATNPCGEQALGPYENCCLGSINLANFVDGDSNIDWFRLGRVTQNATEFLDDVIDANKYVSGVPQVEEAALRARRIGLGIMGWADMLFAMKIPYGSKDSLDLARLVMEWIQFNAEYKSIFLSSEYGSYPSYDKAARRSKTHREPLPLCVYDHWNAKVVDWGQIQRLGEMFGYRNATLTTIAPTGTISTVAGVEGYGMEPAFALAYVRHVKQADGDMDLQYVSPALEKALQESSLVGDDMKIVYDYAIQYGTLTGLDCNGNGEMEEIVDTFVTASDIGWRSHVNMQTAFQEYVDNSISKTINMRPTATVDDVREAYMDAWRLKCKGITVYVEGSRDSVILEVKKEEKKEQKRATQEVTKKREAEKLESATSNNPLTPPAFTPQAEQTGTHSEIRSRPAVLHGATYREKTPVGQAYVTINSDDYGQPFEVFINVGKAGSEVSAVSESFGRIISLILRSPSPISAIDRLDMVAEEMANIGGGRSIGFGPSRVTSLPDGIARILRSHSAVVKTEKKVPVINDWTATHRWPKGSKEATASFSKELMGYVDKAMDKMVKDNEIRKTNAILNGGMTYIQKQVPPSAAYSDAARVQAEKIKVEKLLNIIGDICPECGNASFIYTEGCRKCASCGYSEC